MAGSMGFNSAVFLPERSHCVKMKKKAELRAAKLHHNRIA